MSSFKDTFSATASKAPNGSTLSDKSSHSSQKEKRPHSGPDFAQDTNKKLKNDDNSNDSKETFSEPPKKISFGLSQKKASSKISFGGIKIGLQKPASAVTPKLSGALLDKKVTIKPKIASAFEDEEDEDEKEEMPPEAKMRMKNIGRDTPTSAGPNSFGKGRMGFCDAKKLYERQLKETEEKLATDKGK